MTILVVGAGAAGVAVATELARQRLGEQTLLVGDSPPVDRPPLSKGYLNGEITEAELALTSPAELNGLGVEHKFGRSAISLDLPSRVVGFDDGTTVGFEHLVIATGVSPRLPVTDRGDGVHVLRTVADADRLRRALSRTDELTIVGASVLATEVAATASAMGKRVTIVAPESAPLATVLPPAVREEVRELHEGHDVDFRLGQKVTGLKRGPAGQLRGVVMEGGAFLETSTVLFATGCAPRTGWLADPALDVNDGLACDEYGRAAPGVWAVGDVARWLHPSLGRMRLEHRTNAAMMGMTVACNIAATLSGALMQKHDAIPYFWTDQHGFRFQVYGECMSAPLLTKVGSFARGDALALFGSRNRPQGVVAVGRSKDFNRLRQAVTLSFRGEDVSEIVGEVIDQPVPC